MASLLDPAILFFFFGVAAALVRSNLEIPRRWPSSSRSTCCSPSASRAASRSSETGVTREAAAAVALGIAFAFAVPAVELRDARRRLAAFDAAAVAAAYGSVPR